MRQITFTLPDDLVYGYKTGSNTIYHSSGVVMFEDTSKSNTDKYGDSDLFGDMNDLVVDYNLESTTKQLKVV